MKKIIAAVLLLVMAISLFSCAKPDFYELDSALISTVNFVATPDAEIDKDEFVKAYNAATVKGSADEDDETKEVVVVVLANEKTVILYYLGDDEFAVTGTAIEKDYIIEASELAELYNGIVHPQAEFAKIDAETFTIKSVKKPDAEINDPSVIKAYNDAKFLGNADDVKASGDTLVIICNDGEYSVIISYLGKNRFHVDGTDIEIPYLISSKNLAEIYTDIVK